MQGAMPTDVFGRGHVTDGDRHAHEDVGMAPRHQRNYAVNHG